ncbi:peptide ABC transporter ATP-binding protein [Lentibacillus populi]|uniref:Peptide ABC transporter ATP-binding protein n=1 Tax=Lentibacillus populi TaxID=1827502 RepID=A0A9W5TWF9_9BACI|nr:ABC transporter ATP-binding protein [Lentibacillus populi]GGB39199.1 peptide ABC transporter ATP-binding protein [Lentibacillus populi]
MGDVLLEVKGLHVHFVNKNNRIPAIEGVDFKIREGETLGIVGESGCGKSITSMSILKLLPPEAEIVDGDIYFKGSDLTELSKRQLTKIRGNAISMIFQEPMTSLNPVYTIGNQISEALRYHYGLSKKQSKKRVIEMLKLVGIPAPEKRFYEYPHELSGGMRQRIMIAMALICNPDLLIADEPTTALDVTIQAQILELMKSLKNDFNTSIIMISHDLGVIAEMTDNVLVMYGGMVVENCDVKTLFENPLHPYTKGLLNSLPKVDERKEELNTIDGAVPSLSKMPAGCKFWPRCPYAMEICKTTRPDMFEKDNHKVRCFLYDDRTKGEM